MIHFQFPEATGTEFVSVCEDGKTHSAGELTRKWYQVSEGETQPHATCDLCEFDEGKQQARLHRYYSHGLLKRKESSFE